MGKIVDVAGKRRGAFGASGPTLFNPMTLSRFDGFVWLVVVLLAGLIGAILWSGNQVGLEVLQFTPGLNSTTLSTDSQVQIVFADVLASLPAEPITFSPPVSGTLRVTDNTLTFQPQTPLPPDTDYKITLHEGITAVDGRRLKQDITWQLRTVGPQILFIQPDESGPEQLYVVDPAGNGPPRQLSQATAPVTDFAVAPDHARIAYAATSFESGQAQESEIWVINRDGSDAQLLLACPTAVCSNPVWLPDGRRLVYERRHIPDPATGAGNPRLYWLDALTGETVPVFADSQVLGLFPAISPDGAWLSFYSPLDQGLQLVPLAAGSATLFPNQMGSVANWHPDSQALTLPDIRTQAENWQVNLAMIDLGTGESQPLADQPGMDDREPVWGPDGEHLVFGRKLARDIMGRQIWLLDMGKAVADPLTDDSHINHTDFDWSPDGRRLLYQRTNLEDFNEPPAVWLLDMQTGESTEVATPAIQPAWLP